MMANGYRFGSYEILSELGAGGGGVVYRAVQQPLGREVALKLLPVAHAGDVDLENRFRRENIATSGILPVGWVSATDGLMHWKARANRRGPRVGDVPMPIRSGFSRDAPAVRLADRSRERDGAITAVIQRSRWP
jgi:hypothetical protein